MCAIVGFDGDDHELLIRVLEESRVRGLHAFGYAFADSSHLLVRKYHHLSEMTASILEERPTRLVAHCRYSTSGDFSDHRNNQPVQRGGRALVFNGVIDMGTKAEMELRHHVEMETENDGELVLIWQEALGKIVAPGSFAGLVIDDEGVTYVSRNSFRPAWLGKSGRTQVIGSTADILRRAGLSNVTEIPVGTWRFPF